MPLSTKMETTATEKPQQRCAALLSDKEVVKARQQATKGLRKTQLTASEWAQSRLDHGVQIQPLMSMDKTTLQYIGSPTSFLK